MDTDKLNRWLALGANLAVLASIVFLAVEIQQNTEMTRAQITQSRAETAIVMAEMMFNSEYIPAILEKANSNESLTYQESVRYSGWLRATLRNIDNNYQQSRSGLLGEHIPRASAYVIRAVILSNQTARNYWSENKTTFSDEFIIFVDDVLSDM